MVSWSTDCSGDDPVPSLEYEGQTGSVQLTSSTLQASSRSGGSAHGFRDKEKRKMEGDRKT